MTFIINIATSTWLQSSRYACTIKEFFSYYSTKSYGVNTGKLSYFKNLTRNTLYEPVSLEPRGGGGE